MQRFEAAFHRTRAYHEPRAQRTGEMIEALCRHGVKLVLSAVITVSLVSGLSKSGLKFIPDASAFDHVR